MTTLTATTVLIIIYGLVNKGGYVRALALGGSTAAGSALVLSSVAVPTFYAVALGLGISGLLQFLARRPEVRSQDVLPPGVLTFILFFLWSVLVTVAAPLIFDGLVTVTPRSTELAAGTLTSSNLAQIIYLALGICVLIFVARSPAIDPSVIALSVGTSTLLSAWRYVSSLLALPFPVRFFDNSPAFAYIESAPGGVARFRGILTEPAGLAVVSLITIAYMISRSRQVAGLRRVGCLILSVMALYLGILSTSATFVVAGVGIILILLVTSGLAFLSRRSSWNQTVAVVGCLLVGAAIYSLPLVFSFVTQTINRKVSSSSYTDRSSANSDALRIFLDTWGFGVGLGSARASSFVPTILCATGIVGTILFISAVLQIVIRGASRQAYRPALWALVALLVSKVTAGPDLSDNTGILWLSLGLLSRSALMNKEEYGHSLEMKHVRDRLGLRNGNSVISEAKTSRSIF